MNRIYYIECKIHNKEGQRRIGKQPSKSGSNIMHNWQKYTSMVGMEWNPLPGPVPVVGMQERTIGPEWRARSGWKQKENKAWRRRTRNEKKKNASELCEMLHWFGTPLKYWCQPVVSINRIRRHTIFFLFLFILLVPMNCVAHMIAVTEISGIILCWPKRKRFRFMIFMKWCHRRGHY